jgi:CRISPR-associated protein Cas2
MNANHASEGALFAVCYDISCDRERRRVDRILCGYGFRVQRSVFECRLTTADKKRVDQQLQALGVQTGHVKFYRVYAGTPATLFGQAVANPDASHAYCI